MHPAAPVAASATGVPVAAKAEPIDGTEAPFLPTLAAYGLSRVTGFLPELPPLARLPEGYFTQWETTLDRLHGLLLTDRFRAEIDARFPHLDASRLDTHDIPVMRRAFVVLSLLASAVRLGPPRDPLGESCAPGPAARAAAAVGRALDARLVAKGAPSLAWMCDAWRAIAQNDHAAVAQIVARFAPLVKDLTRILVRMDDKCDPTVFYRQVRPYVAGWSLINGVTYAGVDSAAVPATWRRAAGGVTASVSSDTLDSTADPKDTPPTFFFAGGSAAQSPMIQALDVFFGIEHHPTGKGPGPNFIPEMREYMPKEHRAFLDDAQFKAPSLRDFVANSNHEGLVEAFNTAGRGTAPQRTRFGK
ncbi:hypothetical protein AMAG_20696 [Allomyces macrogynus ATCC 38327]|uniref:Indoleamine 2,3-dioxygenase n=1 Tax=Allomyces macrogynus (strain ATCC 38327) TaxID=578462 RepID=A0A0L0TF11_ALLM3|nr:hypothetical protein AMAG_20696 [Allomyces macrogynus ATCC 38327]|eukprot:KNE73174.1 hypothetical protein AMAG_20696 [Allomyces macrogynus ATCC 38327]